ncbi:hypothetical protein [Rhodanobacter soli]|uniref:Lipocalin-like domain-containing protein n=1 Tax=Rhodanobacter soli TaxID=590609 RepID=A0ABV2PVR9_9GAMM
MTLQLVSPKAKGDSEELHFGKGTMSATYCSGGMCTGPLTVWKIENNRLKVGYAPTEGDVLVEFTAKKLVLRHPDGKVFVYSIISQSGT